MDDKPFLVWYGLQISKRIGSFAVRTLNSFIDLLGYAVTSVCVKYRSTECGEGMSLPEFLWVVWNLAKVK